MADQNEREPNSQQADYDLYPLPNDEYFYRVDTEGNQVTLPKVDLSEFTLPDAQ